MICTYSQCEDSSQQVAQNDRVTALFKRANTVSVASEWYSAKRNKPSRSCETNGRPYGMTIKSYLYKRAVGGARPYGVYTKIPVCRGRVARPVLRADNIRPYVASAEYKLCRGRCPHRPVAVCHVRHRR